MTTAAAQASNEATATRRSDANVPLPLRGDTLLGICEAVGQELGFDPTWLRVVFAALLLWNPAVVVGSYLGLGVVVYLVRYLLADRKSASAQPQQHADGEIANVEEERLAA